MPAPGCFGSAAQSIRCAAGTTRPANAHAHRPGRGVRHDGAVMPRVKLREPAQSGRATSTSRPCASRPGTTRAACGNIRPRKSESAAASHGRVARNSIFGRFVGTADCSPLRRAPSTALTASRAALTNRSISASVMTSGGAKNRTSPGAGWGPAAGRVRVITPRFIISALRRAANLRSLAKFSLVARSSTNSTAASNPLPPRMSPVFGWSPNACLETGVQPRRPSPPRAPRAARAP